MSNVCIGQAGRQAGRVVPGSCGEDLGTGPGTVDP